MKDGLTKDRHVDLGGNLDEDVSLPRWGVDQVADGEGDVSRVVFFVLFKDNVAPGLVEISACHVGAVESPENRNELDILYFFFTFRFCPTLPRCRILERRSSKCRLRSG